MAENTVFKVAQSDAFKENIFSLTNGRFVVSSDNQLSQTITRVLGSNGNPTSDVSPPLNPSYAEDFTVSELGKNKFVVTWIELYADVLTGQVFNKKGNPIGSEFKHDLGGGTTQQFLQSVTLDDGRVVVAWKDHDTIRGVLVKKNGSFLKKSVALVDGISNDHAYPEAGDSFSIDSSEGSGFLISYVDDNEFGDERLEARLFDNNLAPKEPSIVLSNTEADDVLDFEAVSVGDGKIAVVESKTPDDGTFLSVHNGLGAHDFAAVEIIDTEDGKGMTSNNSYSDIDLEFVDAKGQGALLVGFTGKDAEKASYNIYDMDGYQIGETLSVETDVEPAFGFGSVLVRFRDIAISDKGKALIYYETLDSTDAATHVQSIWIPEFVRVGNKSSNTITGENDDDAIGGRAGNDILSGGRGNDLLSGDAGKDSLFGDAGRDILFGGEGNDTLRGGSGNDMLKGGAGNDTLRGDLGNDVIDGGTGTDVLVGNGGADTFKFTGELFGIDTIKNFKIGKDKIDLSEVTVISSAISPFDDFIDLVQNGRNTHVEIFDSIFAVDPSETIVLKGIDATELSESDFLF